MSMLLSVINVSKRFDVNGHTVQALDNVSFDVVKGECLAIVGESGSGKSTIANIILGIYGATTGQVQFSGTALPARRAKAHRRAIQLVQQNPLSSLNPRRSIGASLRLALACESELVVLDEPTSALDVLVQARVLKLLKDLKDRRGLTYLFITHDLSVVRNIADRVAVFERGRLVELGATDAIFTNPQNNYTRRLIGAVPVVSREEAALRDRLMEQDNASA